MAKRSTQGGIWGVVVAVGIGVLLLSGGGKGLANLFHTVTDCTGTTCTESQPPAPTGTRTFATTAPAAPTGTRQPNTTAADAPTGSKQPAGPKPADNATFDKSLGIWVIPSRPDREGYRRDDFGTAWTDSCTVAMCGDHCTTRENILSRDLVGIKYGDNRACPDHTVMSGTLHDPYTGTTIHFVRGEKTSTAVQIDHIVPLSAAFDLGAANWPQQKRVNFANDPENLIAVSGPANESKSDKLPGAAKGQSGRAWMPPNKAYHCQYATRMVNVARKYDLPLDKPSITVIDEALATCPAKDHG